MLDVERGCLRTQIRRFRDKMSPPCMQPVVGDAVTVSWDGVVHTQLWKLVLRGALLRGAERRLLMSLEESTSGPCSAGDSANSKAKEAPFPMALCPEGELDPYLPDFCVLRRCKRMVAPTGVHLYLVRVGLMP